MRGRFSIRYPRTRPLLGGVMEFDPDLFDAVEFSSEEIGWKRFDGRPSSSGRNSRHGNSCVLLLGKTGFSTSALCGKIV